MRVVFNHREFVERGEKTIPAQWKRCELTRKTNVKIFKNDNGTEKFLKDYVYFDYNGIHIEYSCESEEHAIWDKVNDICDIIDSDGTAGLTANNISWSAI